eukprot:ANDGO_05472.mRNA.1 hypothetical protein
MSDFQNEDFQEYVVPAHVALNDLGRPRSLSLLSELREEASESLRRMSLLRETIVAGRRRTRRVSSALSSPLSVDTSSSPAPSPSHAAVTPPSSNPLFRDALKRHDVSPTEMLIRESSFEGLTVNPVHLHVTAQHVESPRFTLSQDRHHPQATSTHSASVSHSTTTNSLLFSPSSLHPKFFCTQSHAHNDVASSSSASSGSAVTTRSASNSPTASSTLNISSGGVASLSFLETFQHNLPELDRHALAETPTPARFRNHPRLSFDKETQVGLEVADEYSCDDASSEKNDILLRTSATGSEPSRFKRGSLTKEQSLQIENFELRKLLDAKTREQEQTTIDMHKIVEEMSVRIQYLESVVDLQKHQMEGYEKTIDELVEEIAQTIGNPSE